MRFGKTFASYQLAKTMGWKKVLVLTFKPAVQSAWEEDLKGHVDFKGWQFISPNGLSYQDADKKKPFVCFGSFQDYLGKNKTYRRHQNQERMGSRNALGLRHSRRISLRRMAQHKTCLKPKIKRNRVWRRQGVEDFDGFIMPITTDHYLYLSGTPFRAIASGEFIEEQIFNWTYSDEQRAKENWTRANNPYAMLPRMVLLTYQLPDSIREIALQGEYNEFDLNVFFSAEGRGMFARFNTKTKCKMAGFDTRCVSETTVDNLKQGKEAALPFSDAPCSSAFSHLLVFAERGGCHAMSNLLAQKQNKFYHDYKVTVAAGSAAGIGVNALYPVQEAMEDPLNPRPSRLWQTDHGRHGQTVTGIFCSAIRPAPKRIFCGVPRPITVDMKILTAKPQRGGNHQGECYVSTSLPTAPCVKSPNTPAAQRQRPAPKPKSPSSSVSCPCWRMTAVP
jgi:hypothetical protein